MNTLLHAALSIALAMAFDVSAQPAPPTGAAASAPEATPRQHKLYRGSRIIGTNVRDAKDKKIGQIKDLVLDGARGEIAYAVVSFGGVMGVGNKLHAIPWQALRPSDNGNFYILHADSETISQAPGFDKARWPDMADRKWVDEIDRYWSRRVGRGNPAGSDITSGSPNANPVKP
ncbi:PRC-barrel domain-containing protein [Noviherbaspirillum sp.]|uniref:PRC-barrel domain-containing protein n=1 Tax=Noviherbaspirillum sp. TaxID=1926288 RepID=UPI002D383561|nr:PRC-barrel domain-containing protein [Noviherbaspirillum sp.]HZW22003.1 PRC-barrel domain-containing protein [Noviherbaspirillum sp.]